jgi:indolepyruvate ferredoxin oxidoreductase alpha subunit
MQAVDTVVCMGASVGMAHGFDKATDHEDSKKTVGVIGDSTFLHSGVTNLMNAVYNGSSITLIILDNSITGMTGHQQNPTTGKNLRGEPAGKVNLEALCRALGFNRVRVVDPYNLQECDTVLKEELEAEEPSIIISRRPCVMIKGTVHRPPLKPDVDKCVGCKACMQIGCPAISVRDKKVVIDETLCIDCGVCSQMCKFGALNHVE